MNTTEISAIAAQPKPVTSNSKSEQTAEPLPDFEAELRKLPGLSEADINALVAMCRAGVEYAPELRRRKAARQYLRDLDEAEGECAGAWFDVMAAAVRRRVRHSA